MSLTPNFYCLTRPNGRAYVVPGKELPSMPLYLSTERACAAACMLNFR